MISDIKTRRLPLTLVTDSTSPLVARLVPQTILRVTKIVLGDEERPVTGAATTIMPGSWYEEELPKGFNGFRDDVFFHVEELRDREKRPAIAKATDITRRSTLGFSPRIEPHSTMIFSVQPQFVGRIKKIHARERHACGVCMGEGEVGIASRAPCPRCEGKEERKEHEAAKRALVVNDLRIGRDSQFVTADSIPLATLEAFQNEHGVVLDSFVPGILVSMSLSNPLSVPARVEIEFECDELEYSASPRDAFSEPKIQGFSAFCPFCQDEASRNWRSVLPPKILLLCAKGLDGFDVVEIAHADGSSCVFESSKVNVDKTVIAALWPKVGHRAAMVLPSNAVTKKD